MKTWLVCLWLCVTTLPAFAQYQAVVIGSTPNTVTLRCTGYGKKAAVATGEAELSAIRTLLFLGAENTPFSHALIPEDRQTVETKFQDFFTAFYGQDYKQFIESSIVSVPFGKNDRKQKCITMDICLRVSPLRSYLEKNKIIRKFGL